MKKVIISCMAGLTFCCAQFKQKEGEFKEHINKEFTVKAGSTFALYNINGNVKVEGYDGDKVIIEVDKTISGKTEAILEEGKKEFKLSFEQNGDSVIAYISEPWDSRPNRNHDRWDNHKKIEYGYDLDFTMKIPKSLNLHASTVNGGEVDIKNVEGVLDISNVNGAISIENAKNKTKANTVNGEVTVKYLNNPNEASSYRTINGDIRITYKENLSADLSFKTMHGEMFTDFDNAETLPKEIEINKSKKGNGTTYRINKNAAIRIGKGGRNFDFETLNGNVYIKKS